MVYNVKEYLEHKGKK